MTLAEHTALGLLKRVQQLGYKVTHVCFVGEQMQLASSEKEAYELATNPDEDSVWEIEELMQEITEQAS